MDSSSRPSLLRRSSPPNSRSSITWHLMTPPSRTHHGPLTPASHRAVVPNVPATSPRGKSRWLGTTLRIRSEEHTSELQSRLHLVCRLLLEKKKKKKS